MSINRISQRRIYSSKTGVLHLFICPQLDEANSRAQSLEADNASLQAALSAAAPGAASAAEQAEALAAELAASKARIASDEAAAAQRGAELAATQAELVEARQSLAGESPFAACRVSCLTAAARSCCICNSSRQRRPRASGPQRRFPTLFHHSDMHLNSVFGSFRRGGAAERCSNGAIRPSAAASRGGSAPAGLNAFALRCLTC